MCNIKMFIRIVAFMLIGASVSANRVRRSFGWNGNNWAIGCDFKGNDLTNAASRAEDCGPLCAATSECTHFTWTDYNGGTCWMKKNSVSKGDAIPKTDSLAVCGVVESGGIINNQILATRHSAYESGACALPNANYHVTNPVALGDIPALQDLKFKPELCGHVLTVDCGHGTLDIIINNSNLGGGLDLYGSTWDILTNHQPPGVTQCSAKLSSRNPMSAPEYSCYYKPGTDFGNKYYHNVGLLNTNGKIVTGATIGDIVGQHRGANPYFAFDGAIDDNVRITFALNDGSEKSVSLRDCIYLTEEQMWQ